MMTAPGVLPRKSNLNPGYSFGNLYIVKFPITAVCSNVKNLSLILQPGLSRTETALILLMTIPLPLHAVSRVWPWPLAARHAPSAADCFQIRCNSPLQSI